MRSESSSTGHEEAIEKISSRHEKRMKTAEITAGRSAGLFMALSWVARPITIAFRSASAVPSALQEEEATMPKHRTVPSKTACAVVAEDDAGHWVARSAGRPLCSAADPRPAILHALYGEDPARAVLLVPPRTDRAA
jgi:hypothetical protein